MKGRRCFEFRIPPWRAKEWLLAGEANTIKWTILAAALIVSACTQQHQLDDGDRVPEEADDTSAFVDTGSGTGTGEDTETETATNGNSDGNCIGDALESPCWFDASWDYRRKITILSSQISGTEQHRFFPVLISENSTTLRGPDHEGHVGQSDGGDILFTANDGTSKLDHEIEQYTPSSGQLVSWVKIPVVSAVSDTVIYMYYGNAGDGDQWQSSAVWDDGGIKHFRGVWHMGETGQNGRNDSTSHANHCFPEDAAKEAAVGVAGNAVGLDGKNDWIRCGRNESLNLKREITVSAWIKPSRPRIKKDDWENGPKKNTYGFYLFGKSDNLTTLGLEFEIDNKKKDIVDEGTIDIAPDKWSFLAMTFDGKTLSAYVNGELDYSLPIDGTIDDSSEHELTISEKEGKEGRFLSGTVDELRISDKARDAHWLATCFNNQDNPAEFYELGDELTKEDLNAENPI